MGRLRWYKRDPDAALAGMAELTFEQCGCYNRLLDMMYSRAAPLPDDDVWLARVLHCDLRVWRRLKRELVDLGKIIRRDGFISNRRTEIEVEAGLKRVADAEAAGQRSAELRAEVRATSGGSSADVGAKSGRVSSQNKDLGSTPSRARALQPQPESKSSASKNENPRPEPSPAAAAPAAAVWPEDAHARIEAIWNSPSLTGFGRLDTWRRLGMDFEHDVFGPLTEITARNRAKDDRWEPRSLNYFDRIVADAHRGRTAPMPEGRVNGSGNGTHSVNGHARAAVQSPYHDRWGNFLADKYLTWREAQKGTPQ